MERLQEYLSPLRRFEKGMRVQILMPDSSRGARVADYIRRNRPKLFKDLLKLARSGDVVSVEDVWKVKNYQDIPEEDQYEVQLDTEHQGPLTVPVEFVTDQVIEEETQVKKNRKAKINLHEIRPYKSVYVEAQPTGKPARRGVGKAVLKEFKAKPQKISAYMKELIEAFLEARPEEYSLETVLSYLKDIKARMDKKYIPALVYVMKRDNLKLDDINDISQGPFGYGVSVAFGRYSPEYALMTDKEATQAAEEVIKQLIDDFGVTSFVDGFWQKHIDWRNMKNRWADGEIDTMVSDMEEDPDGLGAQYLSDRLYKKTIDHMVKQTMSAERRYLGYLTDQGVDVSDKKAVEEFIGHLTTADLMEVLVNEVSDNRFYQDLFYTMATEWWKTVDIEEYVGEMYGWSNDDFNDAVKEYVNTKSLTDEAIKVDGRGNFLSPYDGEEDEYKGIYIYRLN
jgi:cell fate (sporulation/competence/biofilm development) regulator YlbF (YheA/YmcA/DUF963 family)